MSNKQKRHDEWNHGKVIELYVSRFDVDSLVTFGVCCCEEKLHVVDAAPAAGGVT